MELYRAQWAALGGWHRAYATSDSIPVGHKMKVAKDKDGNDFELGGALLLSWSAMWDLLDKRAPIARMRLLMESSRIQRQ
eukprot:4960773-Pleurochrysis_carterae.AAC.1